MQAPATRKAKCRETADRIKRILGAELTEHEAVAVLQLILFEYSWMQLVDLPLPREEPAAYDGEFDE